MEREGEGRRRGGKERDERSKRVERPAKSMSFVMGFTILIKS